MILAFLMGMAIMWTIVFGIAVIVDALNPHYTDHAGTWVEAWNIMPELCALTKLIKGVK